jgi:predicted O-methyltransferase YrrM
MNKDDIYAHIDEHIPNMEGWCPTEKAKKMVDFIFDMTAPNCVELGVFAGRSLLPIGWAAAAGKGTVTGIDPWEATAALEGTNDVANDEWWAKIDYDYFYKYTLSHIDTHGLSNTVRLLREKSSTAVNKFADGSLDFLHQDGNHSEEITVQEVMRWDPKMKPGAIWVFDDANWATTEKAQQQLSDLGYKCIYTADKNMWKVYQKSDSNPQ